MSNRKITCRYCSRSRPYRQFNRGGNICYTCRNRRMWVANKHDLAEVLSDDREIQVEMVKRELIGKSIES